MWILSYIYKNVDFIVLLLLGLTLTAIVWCIIAWNVLKWFKINILETELYYYNKYSLIEKELIKDYGELKVNRMYLIQEPIGIMASLMAVMMSSLKLLRDADMEHIFIMVELKTKEGEIKRVIIDKGSRLELNLNYNMNSDQKMKLIKLKKNKYTLNEILDNTKAIMGEDRYYNYHYYNNNCHDLSIGVLKSVDCMNDKLEKYIRKNFHLHPEYPSNAGFSELGVYMFSFILSIVFQIEKCKNLLSFIRWRIRNMLYYKRPPAPAKPSREPSLISVSTPPIE
tara:strand:+ start:653 stop:1498 length:846 start_codon:yes stop_codon:yes gene_type:complete